VDSVHRAVECGVTSPPWTGDHYRTGAHRSSANGRSGARELQPRGGGGKEGPVSSMAGSPWIKRWWRGVSLAASGSTMEMTAKERGK
jgi:hypothetical protein